MNAASVLETIDDATRLDAGDAIVVRIPRGIRSKEKILKIFEQRLRFPCYFRGNWDAFEECLHSANLIAEGPPIIVLHEALPFGEGKSRRIYLDILQAWKKSSQREIRLVLVKRAA